MERITTSNTGWEDEEYGIYLNTYGLKEENEEATKHTHTHTHTKISK